MSARLDRPEQALGAASRASFDASNTILMEIFDLDASVAGPGVDANAQFVIEDVGPLPTNQADCEALGGGAIVYERSGNAWLPLTGQVVDGGFWGSTPFGQIKCFPPFVTFEGTGGVEAGKSYRIAATSRDGANVTRPLRFFTQAAVTIR